MTEKRAFTGGEKRREERGASNQGDAQMRNLDFVCSADNETRRASRYPYRVVEAFMILAFITRILKHYTNARLSLSLSIVQMQST